MAKPYGNRSNRILCNLGSAGYEVAKFTGRAAGQTTGSLFKWATTDHTGMGSAIDRMPSMSFFGSLKYIFMLFLINLVGIILGAVWIFLLVAYGIPFLITGHL